MPPRIIICQRGARSAHTHVHLPTRMVHAFLSSVFLSSRLLNLVAAMELLMAVWAVFCIQLSFGPCHFHFAFDDGVHHYTPVVECTFQHSLVRTVLKEIVAALVCRPDLPRCDSDAALGKQSVRHLSSGRASRQHLRWNKHRSVLLPVSSVPS